MGASVNWQTRVSPDLDEKVQRVAEGMGLGKQELIRFVVAQFVDNQTKAMDVLHTSIESMLKDQVKTAGPVPQDGGR